MAGDKDTLLNMGFEAARVDWALRETRNAGLQPALDFLFEHTDDLIPDAKMALYSNTSGSAPSTADMDIDNEDDEDEEAIRAAYGKASVGEIAPIAPDTVAQSIKCLQCDKIFRDTAYANFHAEKSGHDQFAESTDEVKPLTEEEKRQRLTELREKMAAKRKLKDIEDAKEAQANIALQRKAGRDQAEALEKMKQKEAVKAAEEMRKAKNDDKKQRQEILEQIKRDKEERAARTAREKALREGKVDIATPAIVPTPAATAASGSATGDFKDARLRIRHFGKMFEKTLSSDRPLSEVAEFVAAQDMNVNVDAVKFTMQYPRREFGPPQYAQTLRELGLAPSAVLMTSVWP